MVQDMMGTETRLPKPECHGANGDCMWPQCLTIRHRCGFEINPKENTMTRQHIMLDIETLDTTARAVVISIGAVGFTFDGGAQSFPYYRALDYNVQIRRGRSISQSTLHFWSQQNGAARGAAFNGTRTPTTESLHELAAFITRFSGMHGDPLIWAYPASFDLAILEDLYTQFDITIPWGHRDKRCARTLYSLAGEPDFEHKGHIEPHHPVSDCQVQITQAIISVGEIKRIGVNIA